LTSRTDSTTESSTANGTQTAFWPLTSRTFMVGTDGPAAHQPPHNGNKSPSPHATGNGVFGHHDEDCADEPMMFRRPVF
jgi:hypothetical protein